MKKKLEFPSIPSNPFSMLNTPLETLSYRTIPRPPTAQLLGMTILAPMEYGLLPGSLCVHPAPTVSGSLWWILWELPGGFHQFPMVSWFFAGHKNTFVFALFSDMANSHDDPDSLNSFVLRWLFRDVEGLLCTKPDLGLFQRMIEIF